MIVWSRLLIYSKMRLFEANVIIRTRLLICPTIPILLIAALGSSFLHGLFKTNSHFITIDSGLWTESLRTRKAFKSFSFSSSGPPTVQDQMDGTKIAGNFPLEWISLQARRERKKGNEESDHYFYRLKYFILLCLLHLILAQEEKDAEAGADDNGWKIKGI